MRVVLLWVNLREILRLISIIQPVGMLFLIQSLEGTPEKVPSQGPMALLLFHDHGMRMCDAVSKAGAVTHGVRMCDAVSMAGVVAM